MAATAWQVEGDYFETCNCDFLCPCISTNMQAKPTKGDCKVAMVYHVAKGHFGATALDDLSFAVVAQTPGPMIEGNWTVGLIVDERANDAQRDALTAIATGKAGGPMAVLGSLIGNFAGVVSKPIHFEKDRPQAQGLGSRAAGGGRGRHAQHGRSGPADRDRQHGASGQYGAGAGQGQPQSSACVRDRLGRRQRPQQRPLRQLQLAVGLGFGQQRPIVGDPIGDRGLEQARAVLRLGE